MLTKEVMKQHGLDPSDISPAFKPHPHDETFAQWLQGFQGTPVELLEHFKAVAPVMSDYGYWFFLGVLWNAYAYVEEAKVPVETWLGLWNSSRRLRRLSVMKPYELDRFDVMPAKIIAYRVSDVYGWPAYVIEEPAAGELAQSIGCNPVKVMIRTTTAKALFLRRARYELVITDETAVEEVTHDPQS